MSDVPSLVGRELHIGGRTVTVTRFLSEGGFSFVFVAAGADGTEYVLKRMLAQTAETLALVQKEVRLMSQLKHENLVGFLGSASQQTAQGHEIFVLMEFCRDGHLLDIMRKMGEQRFGEQELLAILSDVVVAVQVLHHQSPPIAHRDLKLENVLRSSRGTYVLCDLGSCAIGPVPLRSKVERSAEEEVVEKTTTMMYRAPEMIDLYSAEELNTKVDVWAIGCMLCFLAFWRHPFQGVMDDGNLAILNVSYSIPKPKGAQGYDGSDETANAPAPTSLYSHGLHDLITRCLRKNPALRADIDEVRACIDALRGGRPLPAPPADRARADEKEAVERAARARRTASAKDRRSSSYRRGSATGGGTSKPMSKAAQRLAKARASSGPILAAGASPGPSFSAGAAAPPQPPVPPASAAAADAPFDPFGNAPGGNTAAVAPSSGGTDGFASFDAFSTDTAVDAAASASFASNAAAAGDGFDAFGVFGDAGGEENGTSSMPDKAVDDGFANFGDGALLTTPAASGQGSATAASSAPVEAFLAFGDAPAAAPAAPTSAGVGGGGFDLLSGPPSSAESTAGGAGVVADLQPATSSKQRHDVMAHFASCPGYKGSSAGTGLSSGMLNSGQAGTLSVSNAFSALDIHGMTPMQAAQQQQQQQRQRW